MPYQSPLPSSHLLPLQIHELLPPFKARPQGPTKRWLLMGKKMKMPSAMKHPWQWPSCKQYPKTHSFRASSGGGGGDVVFKTVNSVFFDDLVVNSREESSSSSSSSLEVVVKGVLRSNRLFFQPGNTNSILEEAKSSEERNVVVMAMESKDPVGDFRRSMEEMVESHGVKSWQGLERLLGCYLKVNGKKNHGFIIAAFVLLIVSTTATATDTTTTTTTASSSFSSAVSCFSPPTSLHDEDENTL